MSKRCGWVKINNPLYVAYHDEEWGRPLHDDQALFELLCLETYQAGLSWETVLNKRQAFREAFHGYHLQGVADMTDEELEAASPDFWFVTTQIQLNDQQEITYMEYVFVPWG